jgi:hypothetical protein
LAGGRTTSAGSGTTNGCKLKRVLVIAMVVLLIASGEF